MAKHDELFKVEKGEEEKRISVSVAMAMSSRKMLMYAPTASETENMVYRVECQWMVAQGWKMIAFGVTLKGPHGGTAASNIIIIIIKCNVHFKRKRVTELQIHIFFFYSESLSISFVCAHFISSARSRLISPFQMERKPLCDCVWQTPLSPPYFAVCLYICFPQATAIAKPRFNARWSWSTSHIR